MGWRAAATLALWCALVWQGAAEAADDAASQAAGHTADEMRAGCSGGFTGGGTGFVLAPDGRVWRWQRSRAGAEPRREPLRGVGADVAARFFERARRGGFVALRYRQLGNMSCWLEWQRGGSLHAVVWSNPQAAPPLAVGLFDDLQALGRTLAPQAERRFPGLQRQKQYVVLAGCAHRRRGRRCAGATHAVAGSAGVRCDLAGTAKVSRTAADDRSPAAMNVDVGPAHLDVGCLLAKSRA